MARDGYPVDRLRPDGLNIVPWNVLAFVIGIVLWFLVGVMWKDRAIMVVHVGAFVAILGGYLNS